MLTLELFLHVIFTVGLKICESISVEAGIVIRLRLSLMTVLWQIWFLMVTFSWSFLSSTQFHPKMLKSEQEKRKYEITCWGGTQLSLQPLHPSPGPVLMKRRRMKRRESDRKPDHSAVGWTEARDSHTEASSPSRLVLQSEASPVGAPPPESGCQCW